MKCSKCGFANPEDALFCEKCDWKLDQVYIPESKLDRSIFCYIALILGIVGMIPVILQDIYIVSLIIGAIGLIVGGYAFNVPRLMDVKNRTLLIVISGIGLLLSVFAFIAGLYMTVA